jgi:hypothetical protein
MRATYPKLGGSTLRGVMTNRECHNLCHALRFKKRRNPPFLMADTDSLPIG